MEEEGIMSGFSSGKVEFSKPLLTMMALKDCREKRAVEMKCGYWNELLDKDKKRVKTWIPDSRKTFMSSIISLKTLLSPEIKSDEEFEEIYKKIKEEEGKVFGKYCYTKKIVTEENKIRETEEKYIPQIGENVIMKSPRNGKYILIKGGWDSHVNNYYDDLVPIYDKLFEELNNLIQRMGYYKKKSQFG